MEKAKPEGIEPSGFGTGRRLALRGLHRRPARLLFEPKPTKPMAWRAVFDERTGQQNKRTPDGVLFCFVKGLRKGYKILMGSFCKMGSLFLQKMGSNLTIGSFL